MALVQDTLDGIGHKLDLFGHVRINRGPELKEGPGRATAKHIREFLSTIHMDDAQAVQQAASWMREHKIHISTKACPEPKSMMGKDPVVHDAAAEQRHDSIAAEDIMILHWRKDWFGDPSPPRSPKAVWFRRAHELVKVFPYDCETVQAVLPELLKVATLREVYLESCEHWQDTDCSGHQDFDFLRLSFVRCVGVCALTEFSV